MTHSFNEVKGEDVGAISGSTPGSRRSGFPTRLACHKTRLLKQAAEAQREFTVGNDHRVYHDIGCEPAPTAQ